MTDEDKARGTGARRHKQARTLVSHPLDPIFDERSHVLVLGTMPSPASREARMYYGNPRNRFWPVIAALFGEPVPTTNDERRALVLRHGIALWDVLASCTIVGASDASIADPVPTDLPWLLERADIRSVFVTGTTAERLYRRYQEERVGMAARRLPSTSPANARMSLERLIEAWQPLARAAQA